MMYPASKINPKALQAMISIQSSMSPELLSRFCSLVEYDFMAMPPRMNLFQRRWKHFLYTHLPISISITCTTRYAQNPRIAVRLTANHHSGETDDGDFHDACTPAINTEDQRNSQPMTSVPPLMRTNTGDQLPATSGRIQVRRGRCEA